MSYEIHPETPPQGTPLSDYFQGADLGPMHEALRLRAAEYGLPFSPPALLANSRLAILASEHARDRGLHDPFSRGIFRAYFAEGRDIGSPDVVLDVARAVGLNPTALAASLESAEHADRPVAAELEARRLGVTGVPTFFLAPMVAADDQRPTALKIAGAQQLGIFREALRRLG